MNMRDAVMEDLPLIVGIYGETFVDTLRNPMKYYKKYIKNGNVVVMAKNGIIYGAYVFEINRMKNIYDSKQIDRKRYLWLRQVMVDPKYQGHGLGTQLMADFMMKADVQKRLVCEQELVEWYEIFGFLCEQVIIHKKKELTLMIMA